MKKPKKNTITIRLEALAYAALESKANKLGLTLRDFCRLIFNQYVASYCQDEIRRRALKSSATDKTNT